MAAETHTIDPTGEDATNTPLVLTNPGAGIDLLTYNDPAPERDQLFAGSADTFGDPLVQSRYKNRTITAVVRCYGTEAVMRAKVRECTKKAGKLAQYGGTYQRTLNDATSITFDVLDCNIEVPVDWMFVQRNSVNVTFTMLAKPAGRGIPSAYTTATETTNPELIFTVASPSGDLPARGKLVVSDLSGHDQQYVQWGMRSRTYGTATTNALSYAGTSRLAYGGATALAVSGAVSGTVLNQGTLTPLYQAMMSTASAGTIHCTHVGTYRVMARLYPSNSGEVSAAFEWATGDFQAYTRNRPVTFAASMTRRFYHADLGSVRISAPSSGTARWEGRLLAKSTTTGDDLAVDRLYLLPVDDGYGEARGLVRPQTSTGWAARDEFAQSAGNLNGATLPVGGAWATSGATGDFALSGTGSVSRATSTTETQQRFAIAGSSTYTNTQAQVDLAFAVTSGQFEAGLALRYIDASNYLAIYVVYNGSGWRIEALGHTTAGGNFLIRDSAVTAGPPPAGTLTATVDAQGRAFVWYSDALALSFQDDTFATGGTLASGKVGLADQVFFPGASATRTYDNFAVTIPPLDAAIFSNRSTTIGPDYAERLDSGGVQAQPLSSYRGDYLRVPAGNVAGTVQLIVKASRTDPSLGLPDPAVDDVSATLTVTPMYLNTP